jgi:diphthamide biosynthesis protein 4
LSNSKVKVTTLDPTSSTDYYSILSVQPTASQAEIKAAYHRALLCSHPDKSKNPLPVDIALIKEAYAVLSSVSTRVSYDTQLLNKPPGPRPAQIVSLAELDEDADEPEYRYSCRCGGNYRITEGEMDKGVHLVGCNSCSEVIWVGYEVIEDEAG